MYVTYILYSKSIDRFYIGSTNNLDRRLSEHNRKKGKYTDRGIPWEIVYLEKFETNTLTRKRELEIKKKKSRIYIESLIQ